MWYVPCKQVTKYINVHNYSTFDSSNVVILFRSSMIMDWRLFRCDALGATQNSFQQQRVNQTEHGT